MSSNFRSGDASDCFSPGNGVGFVSAFASSADNAKIASQAMGPIFTLQAKALISLVEAAAGFAGSVE
jgi:hypothetical protein